MKKGVPLAFIHGWGLGSIVWQDFISTYFAGCRVTCVDLFCYPVVAGNLDAWHEQNHCIANGLQEDTVIIAWSMGGLVGIDLAARYRSKVKALILLNSSPCFTLKRHWVYGIDQPQIEQLSEKVQDDLDQGLHYFCGLVARGDSRQRDQLRYLRALVSQQKVDKEALLYWLQMLTRLDLRITYSGLKLPLYLLLSTRDQLIDINISNPLQGLNPAARITFLQSASHASFLSKSAATASFIRSIV